MAVLEVAPRILVGGKAESWWTVVGRSPHGHLRDFRLTFPPSQSAEEQFERLRQKIELVEVGETPWAARYAGWFFYLMDVGNGVRVDRAS